MKITYILLIILACFHRTTAQNRPLDFTYDQFEKQILNFQPQQADLSKKDYDQALLILSELKKDVNNDPSNFNCADYYNVLAAFTQLRIDYKTLSVAFEKFIKSEGSCEYLLDDDLFISPLYNIIRTDINEQISNCNNTVTKKSKLINIQEYSKNNSLNFELIKLINKVNENDKRYRDDKNIDWTKQKKLDLKNQYIVDSLFTIYGEYLGTSLVGQEFDFVMWSVIQHSNMDMMEKYLPIVKTAVDQNELAVATLKLLIDRYYGLKYGYQVFGSQNGFGFELANKGQRQAILKKYGFE